MAVQFDSLADFINMGGYAFFVWISFAVSFLAMIGLAGHTLLVKKTIKQSVEKEQARAQRILQAREKRKQARANKQE